MPYMIYRIEHDGSETIIGCAEDAVEATLIIEADKEQIDWDAGYHWVKEEAKNEPE